MESAHSDIITIKMKIVQTFKQIDVEKAFYTNDIEWDLIAA